MHLQSSAEEVASVADTSVFLERILEIDPDNPRIYHYLGYDYLLQGEIEKAIICLGKAKRIGPPNSLTEFFLGKAYFEQGSFEEAIQAWRRADAGEYFFRRGRTGAEEDFRIAIAINPNLVEAYYALGDLYWKSYRREEAVNVYRLGLSVEQESTAKTWLVQGRLYEHEQRWDDAARAYRQAIDLGAGCEAHQLVGYIFRESRNPERDLEKAIEWFERGVEADPENMWCYLSVGETFLLKEDYEQALAWHRRAREQFPQSSWPPMNIGHVLSAQGNLNQATAYYKEAIEKGPQSFFWPHYYLGQNLLARGDVDGAIAHLQTATTLAPNKASFHQELARAYEAAGQIDEAIREYRSVIEIEPNNQLAQDRLAVLTDKQE